MHSFKAGYFQDKNLQGMSSNELLFTSKIFAGGNVPCSVLPINWAKSLTKFNPKMQDFKRVLGLTFK